MLRPERRGQVKALGISGQEAKDICQFSDCVLIV